MTARKEPAKRRANITLDSMDITDILSLSAGCHPGDGYCSWPTWEALFETYERVREEMISHFRDVNAPDWTPWAEAVMARWKQNPKAPEFTEPYPVKRKREVAATKAWARDVIDEAITAGRWIGPVPPGHEKTPRGGSLGDHPGPQAIDDDPLDEVLRADHD